MGCSASPRPYHTGAETAPLRENRLSRHLGPFPARRCALRLAPPRRGGLRTPGREGITPTGTLPPFGHGPFADPWVTMRCPGLSPAHICGRAERVPPRKPPFASSRAFPRKAMRIATGPAAEGRAPHARKRHLASIGGSPRWATGLSFAPRLIMSCLGMSTALPRGRGDRAPPRKNRPPHRPGSSP